MPFNRSPIQTLIQQSIGDLESRIDGADARLSVNMVNAIGIMHSAGLNALYGKLEWAVRQLFPETADSDYLELYASRYAITRLAATFATGDVTFTGTNGTVIPSGTELQTSNGQRYKTTADGTIASGTVDVPITADDPGVEGNLDAGTVLTLLSSIPGVNAQATVAAGDIAGGADAESDDALLERVMFREQNPPQGGAPHDYIAWARAAHPSVTRVYVYPLEAGDSTVVVRIITDNDASLTATQQVIDAVTAYIDSPGRRPTNAIVTVTSPVEVAVDFNIALTPDTTVVRDAVTAELEDLLRRIGKPQGIIPVSQINEAISTAAGETDHVLNTPAANVNMGTNEIPVLGTFTWV